MRPLAVPNDICGPLTLAAAQSVEREELDKVLREAETLQTVSAFFLFLVSADEHLLIVTVGPFNSNCCKLHLQLVFLKGY